MTFDKAREWLVKLAKDAGQEYVHLRYSESLSAGMLVEPLCEVYVHGQAYLNGPTWEQALDKMERALNPTVHVPDLTPTDQAPTHDVVQEVPNV